MSASPPAEGRPPEIEEISNRLLIHPLARALVGPAVRIGLSPNAISLLGLGFGLAAAVAYREWRDWRFVILGLALMLGWHVCDGLDGLVARATGRASALGRLIDGVCDYLVFISVLATIALSMPDPGAAMLLAAIAGSVHAVQAAWYEGARETWRRRVAGRFAPAARPTTGNPLEWGHNRMEALLGGDPRPVDAALAERRTRVAAYAAATAPLLRLAGPVSANGRTFAIALACLAGNPFFYWCWELIGLTAWAVLTEAGLRRRARLAVGAAA